MDWVEGFILLFYSCLPIAVYCATTFPSRYTANPRRPLLGLYRRDVRQQSDGIAQKWLPDT